MTPANCPRCGGRLARDNHSGRCAPCQAAERDRLTAPPAVPPPFWDHQPVRAALARRHLGHLIRAYRHHPYHGRLPLTQSVVAGWLGITQAQLSRIENGPPPIHLDRLTHWATLLRIPERLLWFRLPRLPLAEMSTDTSERGAHADSPTSLETAPVEGGGTTNRRRFNALAALAGLGGSNLIDALLAADDRAENLGMEHVRIAGSLVERFRQADAAVGADELCDAAMTVHTRLSAWASKARVSRHLEATLQTALADLANQAAWLAIDAERRPQARPYLNDAITRARISDNPREEVRALACLSLLTREDQPTESVHCAEAALRASQGWSTPRLRTLLRLRMAHAYANLGDASGFNREMASGFREFDRGPQEDDPPFLQFVTSHELTGIQGLAFLALDRPARAVKSLAVSSTTRTEHQRNRVLSTVRLAEAEYRLGDVNQAARTALRVLPEVKQLNSGRTTRNLAQVGAHLSREKTTAVRDFIDAYRAEFGP
ncbi:helix-turn-helix domain-containing protein [Micromonospora maris]|uniref:helix-turn-helix domain-containing protein n=1 Tax=Micromonospora TaxID=1873 RepID=UPI000206B909|nr:helix-turn-helix transcriptional regulator [Micromonospora maris]AEB45367.1 hypothetical protein VAB18032_21335 [Micromonospora maris AB-18-032]